MERMKWIREKERIREKAYPGMICFLFGFLVGSLLPNFFWKNDWSRNIISSVYLLKLFERKEAVSKELFRILLKQRGTILSLVILSGYTVFGIPVSILWMIFTGGWCGAILTVSVLHFGLYGSCWGPALLLPQMILYLPVRFLILEDVYKESSGIWNKHGALGGNAGSYLLRMAGRGAVYLAGILLEAYYNPRLLKLLMEIFPIFEQR